MNRGVCLALMTGGLATVWFGADPAVVSLLFNSRQNDWARAASKLACDRGQLADQFAVRLIQASQCHNGGAVNEIEHNQAEVLQALRSKGGC